VTTRQAPTGPAVAGPPRLAWADQLRAVAIVLVVFLHVCNKHFTEVTWPAGAASQHTWTTFNEIVWPLLMPAFFLVAGFFASRSIDRPWPQYRVRAFRPYYLYVVWLAIFGVLFWFGPTIENARFKSFTTFVSNLVYPQQALWFLYGLALFFLAARAFRSWRAGAVAASVVVAIKGPTLLAGYGHWPDISENLVYFLVGAYAPGWVQRVVDRAGTRDLMLSAVVFAIVTAIWQTRSPDFIFGATWAALWFALNATFVASRSRRVASLLAMLGSRTLAIYVIHLPIVAAVHFVFRHWLGPAVADAGWIAAVYPVAVTGFVVAASLAVETGLRRAGATWLFDVPEPLRRALSSASPKREPQPAIHG